MESDGFGTEKVLAGGEAGGDLDDLLAAVVVKDIIAVLLGGGIDEARLEDLDPGGGTVGSEGVADFGDVDRNGTLVVPANGLGGARAVVVLLVHLNRDSLAGHNVASCGGLLGVDIATDVLEYMSVNRNQTKRGMRKYI